LVRRAALGILAGALALTACGGGEGTGGAQQDFAEQVDVVCEETQAQVGPTLGDDAAADRDAVRAAAERLHALDPDSPAEDEAIWKQFLADTDNLWINLEDVAQARDPSTNEAARAQTALDRANTTNQDLIEFAQEYGMEICADGGFAEPPPRSRRDRS
jgi:hypothetical protein